MIIFGLHPNIYCPYWAETEAPGPLIDVIIMTTTSCYDIVSVQFSPQRRFFIVLTILKETFLSRTRNSVCLLVGPSIHWSLHNARVKKSTNERLRCFLSSGPDGDKLLLNIGGNFPSVLLPVRLSIRPRPSWALFFSGLFTFSFS